jgi:SAM-dependent methyltransferase
MGEVAKVWHYGLVAEMWAAGTRDTRELDFLLSAVESSGQPVLDVGCGTGRLLVPLREAGIDVDGADISADMLAGCRTKLAKLNLKADLYESPMDVLDLPRTYRVIYIADSFGLAGSRDLDEKTLRRACLLLEPGGVLIFNKEAPYALDDWPYWRKENRGGLPSEWPDKPNRRKAEDGSEYLSWLRETAIDPLEQTYELEMRVQKRIDGELEGEEVRKLAGSIYFRNELVAMLEKAGFSEVKVFGGYNAHPATADDEEFVYLAVKAS